MCYIPLIPTLYSITLKKELGSKFSNLYMSEQGTKNDTKFHYKENCFIILCVTKLRIKYNSAGERAAFTPLERIEEPFIKDYFTPRIKTEFVTNKTSISASSCSVMEYCYNGIGLLRRNLERNKNEP